MKEVIKYLEEIKEHQMQTVQLARSTKVYKLSDKALDKVLTIHSASKRYFLFECINADRQKLKKLIIAPALETAIADIETNYPYITKWFSSEELN